MAFELKDRHFVPNKCNKGAKTSFKIINSLKVEKHYTVSNADLHT